MKNSYSSVYIQEKSYSINVFFLVVFGRIMVYRSQSQLFSKSNGRFWAIYSWSSLEYYCRGSREKINPSRCRKSRKKDSGNSKNSYGRIPYSNILVLSVVWFVQVLLGTYNVQYGLCDAFHKCFIIYFKNVHALSQGTCLCFFFLRGCISNVSETKIPTSSSDFFK